MTNFTESISYIESWKKLDEELYKLAPKRSVAHYASKTCIEYWNMAIVSMKKVEEISNIIADGRLNGRLNGAILCDIEEALKTGWKTD